MNNQIVTDPDKKPNVPESNSKVSLSKPNETGGIHVMTHLKISDPNTKQILLQKRGDD